MKKIRYFTYFIALLLFTTYSSKLSAQTDACTAPTPLGLACNVSWDVVSSNTWSTNAPTCYATPTTSERDAWGTITGDAGAGILGDLTLEYTSNRDAVLVIWTGTCGSLTTYECVDNVNTRGTESLTIPDVDDGEVFYVQVIDKVPTALDMLGSICVYTDPKLGYDLCNEALAVNIGDCDFSFDVTSTNHNNERDGVDLELAPNGSTTCQSPETDAWMKFIATETGKVGFSYTIEDKDAALEVYEATGTGCDNLVFAVKDMTYSTTNACVNDVAGSGEEIIEFSVNAGQTYYIRVMNVDALGGELVGTACLYKVYGANSCGDLLTTQTLDGNTLEGAICNLNVTIPDYYSDAGITGGASACPTTFGNADTKDIWLHYRTSTSATTLNLVYEGNLNAGLALYTATSCPVNVSQELGGCADYSAAPNMDSITVSSSTEYYIRVSAEVASGAMLQGKLCIFEGSNSLSNSVTSGAPPPFTVGTTCQEFPAVLLSNWSSSGLLDVSCVGAYTPAGLGSNAVQDGWLRLDLGGYTGNVTVLYDNSNNSASASSDIAIEVFSGPNPITTLTDLSTLTPTACSDNATGGGANSAEGVEKVTFSAATGVSYYVRVSNVSYNTDFLGTIPTTFGKICIFQQSLEQGDLCSDPKSLIVGDCDIEMDIPTTFFNTEGIATPSCIGSKTITEDLWVEFTATASSTTLEYFNENGDVMIAAYKGSCGSLSAIDTDPSTGAIEEACADAVNGTGIEEVVFPTIAGNTYYIRIMNVGGTANIDGRICIYNTAERDACDENDLITLVPDACNINFKVRSDFELSGPQLYGACGTTTHATYYNSGLNSTLYAIDPSDPANTYRDAFVKFIGKGGPMTVQYESNKSGHDPVMVIYTAVSPAAPGPINCGSGINGVGNTVNNEFQCVNQVQGNTVQTESVTFTSEAGRLYVLRIIDAISPAGEDMTGTLCLFEGESGPDDCSMATDIDIIFPETGEDVGKCNQQFSILNSNTCSTTPPVSCASDASEYYINIGGGTVTTADGITWMADDAFATSSSNPFSGGSNVINVSGCTGYTDYAEIFKSGRWQSGDMSFSIPVATGYYDVTLLFSETNSNHTNCTNRRIDAVLEGITFLDNYVMWSDTDQASCSTGSLNSCRVRSTTSPINVIDGFLNINLIRRGSAATNIRGIIIKPNPAPTGTVCQGEAWFKFTTNTDPTKMPGDNMTVQYDNTNNTFAEAPDVSIEVYREDATGSNPCTTPANYTLMGCTDNLIPDDAEGVEEVNFPVDNSASGGNQTFYVRVVNKDANQTVFGKLCIFYGETIASQTCVDALDYGDLTGVWKNFTVDNTWDNYTMPGTTIPDCIEPGGSNPKKPNPPIESQGWFKFHIENSATEDAFAVTVQHDNSTFSSTAQNSGNAGIAVYRADNPLGPGAGGIDLPHNLNSVGEPDVNECDFYDSDGDGTYDGGPGKLTFIDCSESVWRGAESVTLTVEKGYWYFVRVMNVRNTNDMPGRIRVFKHTDCSLGPQLVVDGNFAGWPAIDDSANPTPTTWLGNTGMDNWILPNPDIQKYDRYNSTSSTSTNIVGEGKTLITDEDLDHYTRFATDYGYLKDKRNGSTNTLKNLNRKKGEFNPEGRYIVAHQSFTRKGGGFSKWDFYCYGNGHTGYGGWKYNTYCDTGQPEADGEPCIDFGNIQNDRPALIPTASEANYMAINGWWRRDGLTNPGKVWCQTVDIASQNDLRNYPDAGSIDPTAGSAPRYFVFSAWCQNLIATGRNLDVPQLRFTVCDMHDGTTVVDAGVVTAGNHPLGSGRTSPLPGVTYTPGYDAGAATWNNAKNPNHLTVHYPQPPNNGNVLKASPMGFQFGAAMPCNLPSEPENARIKILGSDFLIPESPDEWVRITCIYRAPPEVTEFNMCIDNLSLTKNGNDFALDDISLQQCTPSTTNYLDDLLKGDACELSDEPTSIGLPLALNILDFTAKEINQKVALNWTLILDERITKFEIERSMTGFDFTKIGAVEAEGKRNDIRTFRFDDTRLPYGVNTLYYRLKVWDDANKSYYSDVRIVRLAQTYVKHELKLIPNPTGQGDDVVVAFMADAGTAEIRVFDLIGEKLLESSFEAQEGQNQFTLNTSQLLQGLYIVQVIQNGIRMSAKLIVR